MIAAIGIDFSASAIVVALLVFALLGWAYAFEQRTRGAWALRDLPRVEEERDRVVRVAVRCFRELARMVKEPIPTSWYGDEPSLPKVFFLEELAERVLVGLHDGRNPILIGEPGTFRGSDAHPRGRCWLALHSRSPGSRSDEHWEVYQGADDGRLYDLFRNTPENNAHQFGPVRAVWFLGDTQPRGFVVSGKPGVAS